MKLTLIDTATDVLGAWRRQFLKRPEVEILEGSVFDSRADALVIPGNSFGFLDSGLGLEALERFGWELESQLRETIKGRFDGELLVGQAVTLELAAPPRTLIYAPIWRTEPRVGKSLNAFLALRAALGAARRAARPLESVAAPSLGVAPSEGAPGIHPLTSARQMRYAYEVAVGLRGPGDKNLSQQARREKKLESLPLSALEASAGDSADD